MGDVPLSGDFRMPREAVQEVSDNEEDQGSEVDEDCTYTMRGGSSTQRTASMNANHTPVSPSALPSLPFSPPPPPSTGINHSTPWISRDPSSHAMGLQFHQSPTQTWYNGGVYNMNSHNNTMADTRDSYNDSPINIGDSKR